MMPRGLLFRPLLSSRLVRSLSRPSSHSLSVRCYTDGKTLFCKAAVARAPGEELTVEMIEVQPPKPTEVRIKMIASAICHTDDFTLSGSDPEGLFPCILGHEGAGIVESVGSAVEGLQAGDHVIPLYTPECGECKTCKSGKSNLCTKIRATQGKGLMPDGSSRYRSRSSGDILFHFMGCSTFSQYIVMPEIAVAKISKRAPLDKICLLGCGTTTGLGAVSKTAKVEAGATVAVFGLGAVGLNVIQGARIAGARQIIAVDLNPEKFAFARQLGATDFLNPSELPAGQTIVQAIQQITDGGADYSFECIGNVKVMRDALECTHRGWGKSIIIGVAGAGQEISTRPFQLVTGRSWMGTAFGGYKGRSELPGLVEDYLSGKVEVDSFISQTIRLEEINKGFESLREGKAIRTVILY